RDDGLEIVGPEEQHQRDADDERHLEERQHHRQRLAHDVHGREEADCTSRHTEIRRTAGYDIRQRLADLATVVRVDLPLIHYLPARCGNRTDYRIVDLVLAQEARPLAQPRQEPWLDLTEQAVPQSVATIEPP